MSLLNNLLEPKIFNHGGPFRPDEIHREPAYGFTIGIQKRRDGTTLVGVGQGQHHLAIPLLRKIDPNIEASQVRFTSIPFIENFKF